MIYLLQAIFFAGLFICIQIQLVLFHKQTKFADTFCKNTTISSCNNDKQ